MAGKASFRPGLGYLSDGGGGFLSKSIQRKPMDALNIVFWLMMFMKWVFSLGFAQLYTKDLGNELQFGDGNDLGNELEAKSLLYHF